MATATPQAEQQTALLPLSPPDNSPVSSSDTSVSPSHNPQKPSPAAAQTPQLRQPTSHRPVRSRFLRLLPHLHSHLAFPDPATERAFQSYFAMHRPISDRTAILLVAVLIIPAVAPRTAFQYACCPTPSSSQSPTTCPALLTLPAATQQLLATFPCHGSWAQQLAWWLHRLPQAFYWVLLQPNVLEFGAGVFCLLLLLLLTPFSKHPGFFRLRTPAVTTLRAAEFMLSAAAVLMKAPDQPSFAEVHFSRQTFWGASVLLWHCLLHALPFDLHVRLLPLEWASVAICVFARNPHLLWPATLIPILFAHAVLGVLLPTALLYIMEAFQRRQFLQQRQQQQQQHQHQHQQSEQQHTNKQQLSQRVQLQHGYPAWSTSQSSAAQQCAKQAGTTLCTDVNAADATANTERQLPHPRVSLQQLSAPSSAPAGPAAAGIVPASGKASSRARLGSLYYEPVTSRVLVSAKILDPAPHLEAHPAPLVQAVQSTLRAAAGQQATPGPLTLQHAVFRGCIQLLFWVSAPRPHPAIAEPADGSLELRPDCDGPAAAAAAEAGGLGVPVSQIVSTIASVCAGYASEGKDVSGQDAASLQPTVSVTVQQLFSNSNNASSFATSARQDCATLAGSAASASVSPDANEASADRSRLTDLADKMSSSLSPLDPAAGHDTQQPHTLEGAGFWVQGGSVCCLVKQDEVTVGFQLQGAGTGTTEAVRGVLLEMHHGGLLLDVTLEVELAVQDTGAAVGFLRLPLGDAKLPSTPTPLQLLLLPANDKAGRVLWSCPLLAGLPPAIVTELHSLYPAMLAALLESQAEPAEVPMPVASAALEAQVSAELYLPFVSELCLAAWPPVDAAAELADASGYATVSSAAAGSASQQQQQQQQPQHHDQQQQHRHHHQQQQEQHEHQEQQEEQSRLLAHLAQFLQCNDLQHSLAWLLQQSGYSRDLPAGCGEAAAVPTGASLHQLPAGDTSLPSSMSQPSPSAAASSTPTALAPPPSATSPPTSSAAPATTPPPSAAPPLTSSAPPSTDSPAAAAPATPPSPPIPPQHTTPTSSTSPTRVPHAAPASTSPSPSKPPKHARPPLTPIPQPSTLTITKAVLRGRFPDPLLERQYRKYHLVQTATLDRQAGALQLLVNLAHIFKSTSRLELCLMTLLFVGHLLLYPLLAVPLWRRLLPRRAIMLVLQLVVLLPPSTWCLLGQPFPEPYVLLWQDSPYVAWLHAIMVAALFYQVGLWQTIGWGMLYATLISQLVPFHSVASGAVTMGVLVVAPSAAAAAVEYMQRRSFLAHLRAAANQTA